MTEQARDEVDEKSGLEGEAQLAATGEPLAAPGEPPAEGWDLRSLLHAAGTGSAQRALHATLPERPVTAAEITLLDAGASEIIAPPLEVGGFVDGIQAAVRIAYRAHRPIYLAYAAAGAVAGWGQPVGMLERLHLVGAALDRDWIASVNVGLPVTELEATSPPEIERAASQLLGRSRDALERALIDELLNEGVGRLVIDGSLTGRPSSAQLVGVVKTSATRYLPDERPLWDLPVGWRSARFTITEGESTRYSCYLRLQGGQDSAWDFGLVRLEARDAELLDPLGALALQERQGAASGDGRFDRHLATVRACEDFLRARRPAVFSLTG